jgi:hypothetical protein
MSRVDSIRSIEGAPYFGWDDDTTKAYIVDRPLAFGDIMLIYNGQANMNHYEVATVVDPALGRQKRVLLSTPSATGGMTFYRSGKNCFSPKGQSRMLPPASEIMERLGSKKEIWFGW